MSTPIDLRKTELISPNQLLMPEIYRKDLKGILIPEGLIHSRISMLAEEISRKYSPQEILAICVLDGAIKFYTELLYSEQMWAPFEIQTLKAKSYVGTESQGEIDFQGFDYSQVQGRVVIVVEDIIDTGNLLNQTLKRMKPYEPASLEVACLLDKPERRHPGIDVIVDYCGFIIPNEFVVGYGLDYNNHYRGLRHLCVLKEEVIGK